MNYTELMDKCRTCRYKRTSDDKSRKESGTIMWCSHPRVHSVAWVVPCFHARCDGKEPAICGMEAKLWEPIE
jgi:hypothetical protein